MSRKKAKKYSPEFKAKVALEALKEEKSLSELAAQFDLHPNLISKWKRQALEGLVSVFARSKSLDTRGYEEEIRRLQAKIGELVVERDFLAGIYRKS